MRGSLKSLTYQDKRSWSEPGMRDFGKIAWESTTNVANICDPKNPKNALFAIPWMDFMLIECETKWMSGRNYVSTHDVVPTELYQHRAMPKRSLGRRAQWKGFTGLNDALFMTDVSMALLAWISLFRHKAITHSWFQAFPWTIKPTMLRSTHLLRPSNRRFFSSLPEKVWKVYLSGEIHSDWRDVIANGVKEHDLPVQLSSPNTSHEDSDDCGKQSIARWSSRIRFIARQVFARKFPPCCSSISSQS